MDGVTVLNVYYGITVGWAVVFSISIVLAVIFACIGACLYCDGEKFKGSILIICVLCCMILVYRCIPAIPFYEVALSDEVKFSEFTRHYGIQKVRGQILTVTEVK